MKSTAYFKVSYFLFLGLLLLSFIGGASSVQAYRLEEYALPPGDSAPNGITLGPDGNIWFVEALGDRVSWISPDGQTIMGYPTLTPLSGPEHITTGPDGNIWFTEWDENKIGRISPEGTNQQEFSTPTQPSHPAGIITGPDGNLWYAEDRSNNIVRLTVDGVFTEFPIPTANSHPFYLCNGPDGNIWFVEFTGSQIGRLNPDTGVIDEYPTITPNGGLYDIATGSDGNLWFTDGDNNLIGRISPDGSSMQEYPIPTEDSVPFGIVAGADGNLWFAEFIGNNIGVMNTLGEVIMEIPVPTADSWPLELTLDAIGNVWFTERQGNKIGKIILALIQMNAPGFSVEEGTPSLTLTITRSQDTTHEDRVDFSTADGSALAGVDYVPLQSTLIFAPGETEKTLTIQLLDNPNANGDRSLSLNFNNPTFGVLLGDNQTLIITSPEGGGCGLNSQTHFSEFSYILSSFLIFLFWVFGKKRALTRSS